MRILIKLIPKHKHFRIPAKKITAGPQHWPIRTQRSKSRDPSAGFYGRRSEIKAGDPSVGRGRLVCMGTICPVRELLARSSVGTTCQVQCGNYLPGPVRELLARSSVGTTCQVQCGNYLPGPVWELLARSSVGTTCQVQCGNYLPGPVWELLARSSVGTTCQVQCGNYLPGPVWELLARSSVGTTCQVQCGNYLPGPVWEQLTRSSVGTTCQVQCGNYLPGPVWELLARSSVGTTCQVQCGNYLPGPVWELLAARSSVGPTCHGGPVWSMQQRYGILQFYHSAWAFLWCAAEDKSVILRYGIIAEDNRFILHGTSKDRHAVLRIREL